MDYPEQPSLWPHYLGEFIVNSLEDLNRPEYVSPNLYHPECVCDACDLWDEYCDPSNATLNNSWHQEQRERFEKFILKKRPIEPSTPVLPKVARVYVKAISRPLQECNCSVCLGELVRQVTFHIKCGEQMILQAKHCQMIRDILLAQVSDSVICTGQKQRWFHLGGNNSIFEVQYDNQKQELLLKITSTSDDALDVFQNMEQHKRENVQF